MDLTYLLLSGAGFIPPPKPTFEPLRMHFAVNNSDLQEAKRQLKRGISLEYVTQGLTPLLLAILKEETAIAELLVRGGADVNHAESTRQSRLPLHLAAKTGNLVIVKALLDKSASVHAVDNDDMTALHVACYEGHLDVVQCLIEAGAHVNCADGRGRTALFNATECNHIEVVKYVIDQGAVLNCVDVIGWTPLIQCIVCGYEELVRLLLASGANVNMADRNANTPLHHACMRLNDAQQRSLIAMNIDYNMRHLSTLTPVATRAIRHIHSHIYDIVYVLVDYGADVTRCNVDNDTCLNVAIDTNKCELVELLLDAGATLSVTEPYVVRGVFTAKYLQYVTDRIKQVSVPHVRALSFSCKLVIRQSLRQNIDCKIQYLPLPQRIKQDLTVGNLE